MEVGLEGFFTRPFKSNPSYIRVLMNKHFLTEISLFKLRENPIHSTKRGEVVFFMPAQDTSAV